MTFILLAAEESGAATNGSADLLAMMSGLMSAAGLVIFVVGLFGALWSWIKPGGSGREAGKIAAGSLVGGTLFSAVWHFVPAVVGGGKDDAGAGDASPEPVPAPDPGPAPVPEPASPPAVEAPSEPFNWVPVLWAAGIIVALIVVAVLVVLAVRWRRQRAARRTTLQDNAAALAARWQTAQDVWASITTAIMRFETDPASIFDRPLLGDVREPATAAFYEAFDTAANRNRDTTPTDPAVVADFADAADRARRAFEAADQNARDKARGGLGAAGRVFTTSERADLAKARKLLDMALGESTPAAEAMLAYERMREILDPILTVPAALDKTLALQIEDTHRAALTR